MTHNLVIFVLRTKIHDFKLVYLFLGHPVLFEKSTSQLHLGRTGMTAPHKKSLVPDFGNLMTQFETPLQNSNLL